MNKFYVYLDAQEKQLVISGKEFQIKRFEFLMDAEGGNDDYEYVLTLCKVYCFGYIKASNNKFLTINFINSENK